MQLTLSDYRYQAQKKADAIVELAEIVERLKQGPWALRELNLANNRLLGLSGIEHLTDLVFLNVSRNALMDLEGLSKLKNLVTLYAHDNQLGRVETFVDKNKNGLLDPGEPIDDQSGNGKLDTDPLIECKSMPRLTNLYLHNNLIEKLGSIAELPRLETLFLSGNRIKDASALANFPSIVRLSLSDNKISRILGLDNLPFLRQLYLVENRISDLRPLQRMESLKELYLQRNQIVDASPIDLSKIWKCSHYHIILYTAWISLVS